ncbi:hypothetical protein [Mesorhizobium sp. M0771]|uniref:hypothetical protein n=1 Tax=Mesorhizobium sp. M0771 TaxID=2956997 RepID=UPI00333C3962
MIADVILEGTDQTTASKIVNSISSKGVRELGALVEPLSDFAFALLGIDRKEAEVTSDRVAKTPDTSHWITPHLEQLFEIGTGWLGWSSADTWAATPTEIMIAQRGLIAKLKAIHGTPDDKQGGDPRQPVSPDQVKEGLATLRGLVL